MGTTSATGTPPFLRLWRLCERCWTDFSGSELGEKLTARSRLPGQAIFRAQHGDEEGLSFGSLTNPAPSLEGFVHGTDMSGNVRRTPLLCQIVVCVDSTLLGLYEGVGDGVKILIAFREGEEWTLFE